MRIDCADSPLKGGSPASIWYSTTPREYTSERPSVRSPVACSGLMYCGVPTTIPSVVSWDAAASAALARSEEHTSELQSLAYLVCRLLLEKKKKHLNCLIV